MGYYFYLYLFAAISCIAIGSSLFYLHRKSTYFYFFLFSTSLAIWFFFYYLFFSGWFDPHTLLYISRFDFAIGVICVYNLLVALYYYDKESDNRINASLAGFFILFFITTFFTDLMVKDLTYDPDFAVFREVHGLLFHSITWLHIIFLILFIAISFIKLKTLTYLNKVRFKYIFYSTFTILFILITLQLILPYFGIWILEKEIVIFFAVYVLYVSYNLRRYYFSKTYFNDGRILSSILSLVLSILIVNIFGYDYLMNTFKTNAFWDWKDNYNIINTVFFLILYLYFKYVFGKYFIGAASDTEIKERIVFIQKHISDIVDFSILQNELLVELSKIFKLKHFQIIKFDDKFSLPELKHFFESSSQEKIFINDMVFIDENKSYFNYAKISSELPNNAYLILPIYNSNNINTAILVFGTKVLGDFYTIEEINILKRFAQFLGFHLRYIETYEQLQDLSRNLDAKVDQKTLEYNDLINKQKEFISTISHEIKTPISSAMFQVDSIIEDYEKNPQSTNFIPELHTLYDSLQNTADLLNRLFSVQYFDTRSVTLYKEKIQLGHLLQNEFEIYSRMYPHINFVNKIHPGIGYASVDRIQFNQVVTNLLTNAIKFTDTQYPSVLLEAQRFTDRIIISFEDNGKGFDPESMEKLFQKYSTGQIGSIGLGMGLYLCKRIMDLHGGTIEASRSTALGGGKITVNLIL